MRHQQVVVARRYETILGFVPHGRFHRVFEPGCSIGELTDRLASRCGFVTAIDIAEGAVELARQRCRDRVNVDVRQGSLLDDMPSDRFDLIVFSEIGYYFTKSQLTEVAAELAARIDDGGQLLAAHWTGGSADHILSGASVHAMLRKHLPMEHLHHEMHSADDGDDGFILDIWTQMPSTADDRA